MPLILPSLSRGYLAGLTTSNNATVTKLDVAAGTCRDSTDTVDIRLTSSIVAGLIQTSGPWAAGSTQNKLDNGARANSTWYHVHVIRKDSDGSGDWLFSLSATSPTMPVGYTKFRRIGSVCTDGSGNIFAFIQDGDLFSWASPVMEVNTTNPGTSAVLATLNVPTGVNVVARFNGLIQTDASGVDVYFTDPAVNNEVPSASVAPLSSLFHNFTFVTGFYNGTFNIRTNTSGQIRYRLLASTAGTAIRIATTAWTDFRGRV